MGGAGGRGRCAVSRAYKSGRAAGRQGLPGSGAAVLPAKTANYADNCGFFTAGAWLFRHNHYKGGFYAACALFGQPRRFPKQG